jgi:hypothetical protein
MWLAYYYNWGRELQRLAILTAYAVIVPPP